MKMMILLRGVALVLAVLLVMTLVLTSCGKTEKTDPSNDLPSVAAGEAGLQELMEMIHLLPVGTMGVSVHATDIAFRALNWCKDTTMTSFEISDTVTAHLASLEGAEWELFAEQLDLVGACCYNLYEAETRESSLAMLGIENADFGWTEDTIDKAVSLTSY